MLPGASNSKGDFLDSISYFALVDLLFRRVDFTWCCSVGFILAVEQTE